MKRITDIACSCMLLILFLPLMVIISVAIIFSSGFPVIHWSKRFGKNNKLFNMPKFRTMKVSTPKVATHLLEDPNSHVTLIGSFLRKTSLDELPQAWSILIGDMSLVGPRPGLFNQYDLMALRAENGVEKLTPGLTGWAQINGRDDVSIVDKVQLDVYYLKNISFKLDMKICLLTVYCAIKQAGISH